MPSPVDDRHSRSVPDPIFILGISQRSGTNFLFNLLGLHPDCERVGPIWENFLLNDAQLLVDYADAVYRRWSADWDVPGVVGPPSACPGWGWVGPPARGVGLWEGG